MHRRLLSGWILGAGLAGAISAGAQSDAAPPAPPAWQDARGLLQNPDFIRSASGETTLVARGVSFCGHIHLRTNQWSFTALAPEEMEQGRQLLERALSKYPLALLSNRLAHACLFRAPGLTQFRDGDWRKTAAGTYNLDSVYFGLQDGPRNRGGGDRFSEAVFHHELSSLLVGHNPGLFRADAWRAANPPGFKYNDSGSGSPIATTRFLEDGFVCTYGMSDIENDINTYAMWLFTRADWLFAEAAQHPRVKKKVKILAQFYRKLDPVFTREFFLRHCQTVLDAEDQAQLAVLTQAIADAPADCAPYGQRARFYNNLGLLPEAIQDADHALRLDPRYAYGYFVRGWALSRSGLFQDAADDFTRAISFDPSWIPAYHERAHAYDKLDRPADARQDRKTAMELHAARLDPVTDDGSPVPPLAPRESTP